MKIIDKTDITPRSLDVYALYWVHGVRHHYVIPYEEYYGFTVVLEDEAEVVDNSIDDFVLIRSASGRDMLLHWAAEKGALLDLLIDPPDPDAVAELMRRIAAGRPKA